MTKPLAEMTTGEAEAYRQGYEDGQRARLSSQAAQETGLGLPQCRSPNPGEMCAKCKCWKIFREYCS